MRRTIWAAAVAVLLATGATAVPSSNAATRPLDSRAAGVIRASEGPCSEIQWERGDGAVRALIECVWRRFRPDAGGPKRAIAVATCESGLQPDAVGGDNLGLFQHKARYWLGRFATFITQNRLRRTWGLSPSAFDARTNAIVTVLYVRVHTWSPAWSCA